MKFSNESLPYLSQRGAERELYSRSFTHFIKAAWHVLEPATPFKSNWHIDAICEHLENVSRGTIKNLIINVPPRHMKSLLCSVLWPAWEWTFKPSTRWLFTSYSGGLSTRDSTKCRDLIASPWYQSLFGHIFQLKEDQNQKSRFENTRTGHRIATSVGGIATGDGGDRVVADDLHKAQDAYSKADRDFAVKFWKEVMSTRLNDPKTGSKVIVGQRVHIQDVAGEMLKTKDYELLILPAEYDPRIQVSTNIGFKDPRNKECELLWPEHFGAKEVGQLKKELGSMAAAAQLNQNPSLPQGSIVKRDQFKFWKALPDDLTDHCQFWDATFKDTAESDFVVGGYWARKGSSFYLIDVIRAQMNFNSTVQAVLSFSAKHPKAWAIHIEDKANGPAIMNMLNDKLSGLIPFNPQGSKEARFSSVSPLFEAGNVYLPDPENNEWVHDYIEELVNFPVSAHDDQVDMTSMALITLRSATTELLEII